MIEKSIIDTILKHQNISKAWFHTKHKLLEVITKDNRYHKYIIPGITTDAVYYSVSIRMNDIDFDHELDIKDPKFFGKLNAIMKDL